VIHVDLEALDRQARAIAALGDDLRDAVARWQDALTDPCAPSVRAVRDAYAKDFSAYTEVLCTWADSVRAATCTYRTTDNEAATTFTSPTDASATLTSPAGAQETFTSPAGAPHGDRPTGDPGVTGVQASASRL